MEVSNDVLLEKIEALGQRLISLENSVAQITNMLSGTSGLVSNIVLMRERIKSLEDMYHTWQKILVGICTAIVLGIGGFLWALLTHSITIATKIP